jgi:hypothetical protein
MSVTFQNKDIMNNLAVKVYDESLMEKKAEYVS